MSGKGDGTRPRSVPRATFDANWHRTFHAPDDTFGSLMDSMHEALEHAQGTRILKTTTVSAPEATDAEA